MKILKIFLTNFIIFTLLMVWSCEKVSGPGIPAAYLLTCHIWDFDGLTTNSIDDKILVDSMSELLERSIIDFNIQGVYILSKANSLDFGPWEFNQERNAICFDKGTCNFFIAPIITLTNDILEFEQIAKLNDGKNFKVIWRWARPLD